MSTTLENQPRLGRESSIYTAEELSHLHKREIPRHVAILMDGNRRWATQHELPVQVGHAKGAEQLKIIVEAAIDLGVEILTVFAFSTENRNRTPIEIEILFSLFEKYLLQERDEMKKNGIRLETIGEISTFPKALQQTIEDSKRLTFSGDRFKLVLAINYGARDEITRAVQKITVDMAQGKLKNIPITEKLIQSYLDTALLPDPDLLIRTSGELRLSNFLLWQVSYSEFYFTEELWPDFGPESLLEAVLSYQTRKIRRGL